ncbi:MAG: hypothetical protein AAF821_27480 [Cyanobacteria bacterium P01_D01_bin.156]
MDLLGKSQDLPPQRKRVDGATVYKRFSKAIQDNGGDAIAHRDSVIAETEEMFGCGVRELYQATGAKRGKRETLPQAVQEAYIVNESISANELERSVGGLSGETQDEVNGQIVNIVRETSKKSRPWLPW